MNGYDPVGDYDAEEALQRRLDALARLLAPPVEPPPEPFIDAYLQWAFSRAAARQRGYDW